MKTLIKPKILSQGDKVATISLSWGGAGEIPHRYQTGKRQLENIFGVTVIKKQKCFEICRLVK
jgi:muramoyltetrapeptide carboxypeptidase LdcA involved in peptidoglycan recycling